MNRLTTIGSQLRGDLYVRSERHGAVGIVFLLSKAPYPGRRCALCGPTRAALLNALRAYQSDHSCRCIVIASDSEYVFSRGINHDNFADGIASGATTGGPPSLAELVTEVERSPKVIVAAVSGSCASWGLELILGATYRLASTSSSFRYPEVGYSTVPCGGGALRLTRLVGVRQALHMLCTGERVPAHKAKDIGLVDGIVDATPETSFVQVAVAAAAQLAAAHEAAPPRRRSRLGLTVVNAAQYAWAVHKIREVARCRLPGPCNAVDAVRLATRYGHDLVQYSQLERALFSRCIDSQPECAAAQHVLRALERNPMRWLSTPGKPVFCSFDHVAVIGAGTVGVSVAMLLLKRGAHVLLVDTDVDRQRVVSSTLHAAMQREEAAGRLTSEHCRCMMKRLVITGSPVNPSPAELAEADCVLECASESVAVKKAIFEALDTACKSSCVLASCSSAVSIDQLASCAPRHVGRVVGLHMCPPANETSFVEVVRCDSTSDDTLRSMIAWMDSLGKWTTVSHSTFGPVSTRILLHGLYQGYALVEDGCFHYEVDRLLRERVGMRFGVFELEDIAGLGVTAMSRSTMVGRRGSAHGGSCDSADHLHLPTRAVLDIPEALVKAGHLGRKMGQGWYKYTSEPRTQKSIRATPSHGHHRTYFSLTDDRTQHNHETELISLKVSRAKKIVRRDISEEEQYERVLLAMLNEAACLLAQGAISCAADVDCLSVAGWGFSLWRGGLCYFTDNTLGISHVISRMRIFNRALGNECFPLPCPVLLEMERKKLTFEKMFPPPTTANTGNR